MRFRTTPSSGYNPSLMADFRFVRTARPGIERQPRGLFLLLLGVLHCGPAAGGPSGPPRNPGLADSLAAQSCTTLTGDAPAKTLQELMRAHVNPRLSLLSLLLFHDRRPPDQVDRQLERSEQIAQVSDNLADCFILAPGLFHADDAVRADFNTYAATQRFNAQSLSHAAHSGDEPGQKHWFMHIKENCMACHARHRFGPVDAESNGK